MTAHPPADDRRHLEHALELADRGWGQVQPNPLVGAVVVRDGAVVASGWHERFGGPHAEVNALAAAGDAARGATLYVSLEPCAHHGKTPPCTDAIRRAGITRVVFAAHDPTTAAGGGAARLREAGIVVSGGLLEAEARRRNAPFFHAAVHARPWILLKLAITLDGRIARRAGVATRITGEAAHADVHHLRAGFDAVMVGAGTARVDDPLLTPRGDVAPRVPPARVVLDPAASLSAESRLARSIDEAPLLVFVADSAPADRVEALRGAGAELIPVAAGANGLDLSTVLDSLALRGVRSVLCEGGGILASALLRADLVDRLRLYVAPRLFGAAAPAAFTGGFPAADDACWALVDVTALGPDVRLTYDRARAA